MIEKIINWYLVRKNVKEVQDKRTKSPSLDNELYGVFKAGRFDIFKDWLNLRVVDLETKAFKDRSNEVYNECYSRVAELCEIKNKLEAILRIQEAYEGQKK